jgi:hypothetical protein
MILQPEADGLRRRQPLLAMGSLNNPGRERVGLAAIGKEGSGTDAAQVFPAGVCQMG